MEQFISISSQHATTKAVVEDCVRQCRNAPAEANFGFIYVNDAMAEDLQVLYEKCRSATGIAHWVGTIGLGIVTTGREMYDLPAASIMLAQFAESEFAMVPAISKQEEITARLSWPRNFVTNFGVIHGDPLNPHTQELIEDLQQSLDNGFLVGGLTSTNGDHYQVNDGLVRGGISGVLFSENIGVITNLSQGCSPVGNKHSISRAKQNAALLLDDKPALLVLMQDMDIGDYQQLQQEAGNVYIGLCIPGSDKSDYTIRNLVAVDTEHDVFAINDYLTEDNELIFCRRNRQTAVDDMRHMLDNIAERLAQIPGQKPGHYRIKGGIYVSCLGRGREQFGDDSEEIKMIHETLGEFPLAGFFANGEIHHNKLYGYTGVLTLFI